MARDLFEEMGVDGNQPSRDLFQEANIQPETNAVSRILEKSKQSANSLSQPGNYAPIESGIRNFGAGLLQTGKSALQELPQLPELGRMSQANVGNPLNQRPIDQFNPYKMMDVKEQPWNTPGGAAQTLGSMYIPGGAALKATNGIELGKKALSPFVNVFNHVNPEETAKLIQKGHDSLQGEASGLFDHVGKQVQDRNINYIPIWKQEGDMVRDAAKYFPNTQSAKNLIEKAKSGNFADLRKLQSDLWQRGTKFSKSSMQSERDMGDEAFELRDKINQSISNHFKDIGHEDLSDALDQAKQKYAQLKKVYYGPKVPAAIKNLVDPASRKMPVNIFKTLSEVSTPMNRLKAENPLLNLHLRKAQEKENAIKHLKAYGLTAGLGLSGFLGKNFINSTQPIAEPLE